MHFTYGGRSIRINMPDQPELMTEITRRFRQREGFALATLNLDHLVKLRQDQSFRDIYTQQDLIVADGNPIVWLSRVAGRPVNLVPGSDLVIPLARLAQIEGIAVALLGTTDAALSASAKTLSEKVPGLHIVTKIAPPMGFDPSTAAAGKILDQIRESGARLCFLALGAPKQEALAARGRTEAPEIGFASIGAGLDFLAGNQTRAPLWVRRLAMEWAWRMLSAPGRLVPRYARCAAILPGEMRAALKLRHG
jgi:N-acetylglucosaminyldiphosphoundecaprenol N-acetyl-beta-D-mannosaminyltransferase